MSLTYEERHLSRQTECLVGCKDKKDLTLRHRQRGCQTHRSRDCQLKIDIYIYIYIYIYLFIYLSKLTKISISVKRQMMQHGTGIHVRRVSRFLPSFRETIELFCTRLHASVRQAIDGFLCRCRRKLELHMVRTEQIHITSSGRNRQKTPPATAPTPTQLLSAAPRVSPMHHLRPRDDTSAGTVQESSFSNQPTRGRLRRPP